MTRRKRWQRPMLGKYRLEGREPVYVEDLIEWCKWFERCPLGERVVARTPVGQAEVSTVFLGIDHNWSPEGPPLLFETMIFFGDSAVDEYQWRYATWAAAEEGHARAVALVKDTIIEKVKP